MEQQTAVQEEQVFFSSKNSQLAKARKSIWATMLITLVLGVLISRGSFATILVTAGIVLIVLLPVDLMLRRHLKSGQALVTLTDDAIESPSFSGKVKRILWEDVERVSVEAIQGTPYLRFFLKASVSLPDKRSFWTGANPAQPRLVLSPFAPDVQEQFLDAVNQRLSTTGGADPASRPAICNEIREEREFQEQLKALAPNPWATYALIGLNMLIWLATLTLGASFMYTPAEKLLLWGGNAASEVQRGEWWRLLTATFLHSGFMHVAMNMLGLYTAGVTVERIYGPRLFLLVYFASGLVGSAMSLHFSAQQVVSVGASGAVFGITGALLVAVFQHRDKLPKSFSKQMISGIGFFVIYSLIQGFGRQGIDNAAHIGGLLGGCLAAFILPERFDMEHFKRTFASRAVAAMVAATVATVGLAAAAPKAVVDQARIFATAEFLERGLKGFQSALMVLQQDQNDMKSGRRSEREVDDRSRTVHAPAFRKVVADLSQATLRPGDRREPVLKDALRLSELLVEALGMDSVFVEGNPKPQPVNPARMAQLEAELKTVGERLTKDVEQLNKKR